MPAPTFFQAPKTWGDTGVYQTYGQAIQAALPWGAGGVSTPPTSAAGLTANYQQEYAKSLAMNQSNYNNILRGYQQALAQHNAAQQAIDAGYNSMYNEVIGQIQGITQTREREIGEAATRQASQEQQSLIDRGLGNTTVQQSVNRGIESDKQKSITNVRNEFAGLQASYQNQIRQAQLAAQGRGAQELLGIQRSQLDWMNSVNASYPNAGMYAQLAQQFGQAAAQNAAAGRYGGGSFGGGGGNMGMGLGGRQVGYVPSPAPGFGGGYIPGMGIGGGGGGPSFMNQEYARAANMFGGGSFGGQPSPGYGGYGDFLGGAASAIAGGFGTGDMFGHSVDYSGYNPNVISKMSAFGYGGGGDF